MLFGAAGFVVLFYLVPWEYSGLFIIDNGMRYLFSHALFGRLLPLLSSPAFTGLGVVLLLCQTVGYLGAVYWSRRPEGAPSSLTLTVFLVPGLVALLYLLLPPTIDAGTYLLHARLWVYNGVNPYVVSPPIAAPADFSFHPWGRPFVYGPVTLLYLAGTVLAGGVNPVAEMVVLKAGGGVLHLLATLLVYKLARRLYPDGAVAAVLLYGWNPLVLFELVGSTHNDNLMVVSLLGALLAYIAREKHWVWGLVGWGLAVVATLVKYAAAPFAFFYLVAWMRATYKTRQSLLTHVLLLGLLALGIAGGTFALVPAGSVSGAWHGLQEESSLFRLTALCVPYWAAFSVLNYMGLQYPAAHTLATAIASRFGGVLGMGLLLGMGLWLWQREGHVERVIEAWSAVALISLLLLSPSFFPWYCAWILAPVSAMWPARCPTRRVLAVTLFLTVLMMGCYFLPLNS